ncbi:MAG: lytic murein transglycosylase B [Burkholderiales bacterium]
MFLPLLLSVAVLLAGVPAHAADTNAAPAAPAKKSAATSATKAPSKPKPKAKTAAAAGGSYAGREDVRAFADEVAQEAGLPKRDVERWFADAKYQPKIVAAMDRPLLEPPKWFEYSRGFLAPERVAAGVAFWRANEDALARAQAQYGVPPEIIVAIIGVETYYGRNVGSYRVIDALATLAFDYPRRAPFFRGELKEFVMLARDQGFSPLVPKGSFAGAMGMPQFMPGSYRRFAIDFDNDGHADLWRSNADVIGSVAHYLARHDWQRGQPILLPALVAPESRETALRRLDGGVSERRLPAAWEVDGVRAANAPADATPDPVGLLLLEESAVPGDATLWVAYPNWYVITRYNKSRLYASAVFFLAEKVRLAH